MPSDKHPDPDNPEWTEADFARASKGEAIPAHIRAAFSAAKRGRPAMAAEERKQSVNLRLSPDVLAALRAGGRGWHRRVDELLRAGLGL